MSIHPELEASMVFRCTLKLEIAHRDFLPVVFTHVEKRSCLFDVLNNGFVQKRYMVDWQVNVGSKNIRFHRSGKTIYL